MKQTFLEAWFTCGILLHIKMIKRRLIQQDLWSVKDGHAMQLNRI